MRKTRLARVLALVAIGCVTIVAKEEHPSVAGTYANLSFNVDGAGGQNRSMPRLELSRDKTYRWGRESGTYEFSEGKVYLSGSYAAWGPGRVDKDSKIWFEFRKNGKRYTVTMYRVSRG